MRLAHDAVPHATVIKGGADIKALLTSKSFKEKVKTTLREMQGPEMQGPEVQEAKAGKKRRVQVLSEKAQALIARLRELEIAKTAPGLVAEADHGDPHPPFSLERTLEMQLDPCTLSGNQLVATLAFFDSPLGEKPRVTLADLLQLDPLEDSIKAISEASILATSSRREYSALHSTSVNLHLYILPSLPTHVRTM